MLGALLILLISAVFIMQYAYMNNIIIQNKEFNIEKSGEILGQRINSELKLYSQIIESTASLISTNNWSKDEIEYNIKQIFSGNPMFNLLYYADPNNNLITSINWKAPEGYTVKERPWYIKAVEEGKLIYSETYIDALTGELAISISKPIYDSNHQIQGVVGGDILINQIIKIVENFKSDVSEYSYSFLIDGKGNILAHPGYAYDDYANLKNIDEISHVLSMELRYLGSGKKQITIDEIDGYLYYQPIENTDWIIGNFAAMAEYNTKNQYLWRVLGVALLLSLCILGAFLFIQNKYFMRPLKLLVKNIEDVAVQEDISYRIGINEKDPFVAPRKSINNILENKEYFFRQQQEYGEELMASHEELEAQNIQLYNLSYYDHLTKIYNRRSFEDKIINLNVEESLPLGIIMADVNGLKLINDSFGHAAGDQLLKEMGRILLKACNDEQLVFRMGGDEFAIILPQTSLAKAEKLIKDIRKLSKKVTLYNIKLSISFGVAIKDKNDEKISDVIKKAEDDMRSNKIIESPSMRSKTIDTIVRTLYEKNPREEAHSSRVSSICQQIGIKLGMTDEKIKQLETVGLLHDIGKIAVSNRILEKQGALTDDEREEIQKHPEIGYRILSTTSEMAQIAEYALSHHERYDGKGYPQGLKGEEIPLVSRIITIADSYDAMISDRPYRKGLDEAIAVGEIIKNAGIQFDPLLSKVFVEEVLEKDWIEIAN